MEQKHPDQDPKILQLKLLEPNKKQDNETTIILVIALIIIYLLSIKPAWLMNFLSNIFNR